MVAIKRSPADAVFSKVVREAANWTCEICGRVGEEGDFENMHYFGRRAYSVRFDPANCNCGCHSCHRYFTENPDEFRSWKVKQIGEGRIQLLRERREDSNLAKSIRKNLKDVAKHYRQEFKRLKALRDEGVTGKLEIISYV